MIPSIISADHVRAALKLIDRDDVPNGRRGTSYELLLSAALTTAAPFASGVCSSTWACGRASTKSGPRAKPRRSSTSPTVSSRGIREPIETGWWA